MSRNIKSLKKLHSLIGKTVHVVGYGGHEFDAQVTDGVKHGWSGKYSTLLYTTDKAAEDETFWWKSGSKPHAVPGKGVRWGHIVREQSQLTEELKSVTTTKDKAKAKVKKTTKTFVSLEDLLANEGHHCEMADGSTGFIAGSQYRNHVCVLHNSKGPSEGWSIRRSGNASEIKGVSKDFIKLFSKGWHVGTDFDAEQVKVKAILDETSESHKKKPTDKKKRKTAKYIGCEEIQKNIGKYCKLADGQIAFIAEKNGHARLCLKEQSNGCGWSLDFEDVDEKYRPFIADYKRGWCVTDDWDAEQIKVVEIFEDDPTIATPEKGVKTTKTILDMTVREVLEKLNEIIISR